MDAPARLSCREDQWCETAKGVAKPRTWYAAVKGFTAGKRLRWFETVS
jgi:hypothetical protein